MRDPIQRLRVAIDALKDDQKPARQRVEAAWTALHPLLPRDFVPESPEARDLFRALSGDLAGNLTVTLAGKSDAEVAAIERRMLLAAVTALAALDEERTRRAR